MPAYKKYTIEVTRTETWVNTYDIVAAGEAIARATVEKWGADAPCEGGTVKMKTRIVEE